MRQFDRHQGVKVVDLDDDVIAELGVGLSTTRCWMFWCGLTKEEISSCRTDSM